MIRNIFRNRRRRILAASGTLALCASLAFAAWLTEGTGLGRGKIAQLAPLTIEPGAVPAQGQCTPGNTCPGYLKITNPNPNALAITRIEPGANGPDSTDRSGCGSSELNVVNGGLTLATPIPLPGGGPTEITVPDLFRLNANAPTECQGATVSKNLRVIASTP